MQTWTQQVFELGIGSGGFALAGRGVVEVVKWARHRAGYDEATAETLKSAMYEVRGMRAKLEEEREETKKERAQYAREKAECEERCTALERRMSVMQGRIVELSAQLDAGQFSPRTLPPESLPPPAIEAAVIRALKDER